MLMLGVALIAYLLKTYLAQWCVFARQDSHLWILLQNNLCACLTSFLPISQQVLKLAHINFRALRHTKKKKKKKMTRIQQQKMQKHDMQDTVGCCCEHSLVLWGLAAIEC